MKSFFITTKLAQSWYAENIKFTNNLFSTKFEHNSTQCLLENLNNITDIVK